LEERLAYSVKACRGVGSVKADLSLLSLERRAIEEKSTGPL
jgi:hypothetical protein